MNKLLVEPVSGQREGDLPLGRRIRLDLVHEIRHLDGVQRTRAANYRETLAVE